MKIFLDTANVEDIKEANSWGIVDGVTTNPTLIAREGRDFKEVVEEICSIVDGPISAEVVSMEAKGMIKYVACDGFTGFDLKLFDLVKHLY